MEGEGTFKWMNVVSAFHQDSDGDWRLISNEFRQCKMEPKHKTVSCKLNATNLKAATNKTIFCHRTPHFFRSQFRLKFVGTSACCTVAGFLSWPTMFRLGARVIQIKMAPILRKLTSEPWQSLGLLHTSQQGPTRCFEIWKVVRYHPTSPDFVTDLFEFLAN